MNSIRELVGELRVRGGVRAAVVVGQDGLVIEGVGDAQTSPDELAAHVPALLTAITDLGKAGNAGAARSAVVLHDGGIFIASLLTAEVVLLILAERGERFGDLLFELSRDRERMAALL